MKLEITRSLLLVGSLGVATLAAAAWHEPDVSVIHEGKRVARPLVSASAQEKPAYTDRQLLLLMFGLSQGNGALMR